MKIILGRSVWLERLRISKVKFFFPSQPEFQSQTNLSPLVLVLVYNDPHISLTVKHCSKEYYWAFPGESILLDPISIVQNPMTSFGVLSSSYLFSVPAFNHRDTERGNLMVELKSGVLDLPKRSGIELDRGGVRLLIKNGEAIWSAQGKCVPWDGK